jgi:hypothetical protein
MRNVTPLKGVDTPVWQYMRYSPVATGNGVCMATDPRGASRYIYIFYSSSSFWRYDIYTDTYQQLASPGALGSSGTAGGTGTCMRYDTSKGYVWLLLGATTTVGFGYYNIATDTWTTSTSPTGASSYDYQLVHTDSTVNAAGNDDYLYLAGNGATTFKRYSISGNAWTTLTAMPATPGNGCMGFWGYTQDPNLLYFFRGNATSTLYTYSISAGTWATPTIRPTIETYNTGSCGTYIADKNMYVLQKDNTHRCYAFNLATNEIEPFGYIPYVAGTNVTGDKMVNVKTPDGSQFVYYHRQSGQEMFRNMVYWY